MRIPAVAARRTEAIRGGAREPLGRAVAQEMLTASSELSDSGAGGQGCGSPYGRSLAEVDLESEFTRARALIEEVVRGLGVDPKTALAKEDAHNATWTLQRGSAPVLIRLAERPAPPKGELRTYLRVVSPVLTLAADRAPHEPLFRHLLELNAAGLANAAFGLIDQRIVAVSERPTEDLQATEVDQMIRHLAAVADTYDDRLMTQFGGKPRDATA